MCRHRLVTNANDSGYAHYNIAIAQRNIMPTDISEISPKVFEENLLYVLPTHDILNDMNDYLCEEKYDGRSR
jgi:hypothetical protein